jgi:thiamine biosynthesis lipoprotein
MISRAFHAMGTDITLVLDAPETASTRAALTDAETTFSEVERVCTRFSPSSELSLLNAKGSRKVPRLLGEIVEEALAGRERTSGLFDPTVHDAVVAAGYDRSFPEFVTDPTALDLASRQCGGGVTVTGDLVELDPGVRLDLGGIAKGAAVDRAHARLAEVGPCLVDAGGDIRVSGTWPVAVDGGPTLELTDAAVATSGRDRRQWRAGGAELHHLIDPATARPAVTTTLRATVVAATAIEAEILAKAAFLGADVDAPHVIVLEDGTVHLGGGL